MTDVARLAGVSHQTVSRVLNGHPNVKEQTRLRVRAAMEQLGYRPNRVARTLVTGQSHVVGIVAQNTALYGPTSVRTAVERSVNAAGFAVGVASVPALDRSSIAEAIGRLLDQRVAGVVVIAPVTSANEALDDVPDDLPMVVIGGDPGRLSRLVTIDQRHGARLATRCLLAAGHDTVWHVSGPAGWYDSAERVLGWREALLDAGAEVPPVLAADWSLDAGYEAGQLLARMPSARAVFAASDHLAMGVMKALRQAGRSVPGDVSVVGFDDIPEAGYVCPPLTTVRPDFAAVAEQAVRLLLSQLDGSPPDGPPRLAPVVPALVERDSVAPPR
ncbi:LacI family DNA-binding transcriptional regulator [Frankia sp. CNm7]|uniref:LacI family DNA-binding transcriptional regulator n=1 Tax=Frankia nepalensis TaxID=1836974 RepID=A0A937RIY7_9ACTN|nr:LacI family DNA-binding transcriptional regulator [Frankia nepalensis]MBL7498094.1 LacI family DNA-binding transcriptional regulator [Frankia nepalensis]MBL7509290.1 LacI family DNA-binding transcriptional regulator [Frankia nepalensis]MBL7524480.1 LacI family DNA-binding transcriptional regulator [Frankia nepalensis]MBL7633123.1 LacI family DNA-binding transcriptional regulator [Frankia nepalensis]